MPVTALSEQAAARRAIVVLAAACVILVAANGIRTAFGLFLVPMTTDLGWSRESFALALAIQNVMWGVSQPFAAAYADRFGYGRVIAVSAGLYAAGLTLIAFASTPHDFAVNAGVILGIALSGTGFPIMLSVVGQAAPESRRSLYIGIAGSGGASGQVLVVPGTQLLIDGGGWAWSLLVLAGAAALLVPLAALFSENLYRRLMPSSRGGAGEAGAEPAAGAGANPTEPAPGRPPSPPVREQTLREAIREARGERGYWYLTCGFFVCGFHVTFIGVHLPAFIVDQGLSSALGATSLMLIGLANIVGSTLSGALGGRFRKKNVLSGLYFGRAVVIAVFVMSPVSTVSVVVFSFAIGLLWLSTVPLTGALVAQLFGTRYMATLFGIVFVGHQMGSFLGAWLGGYLYDATGSYETMWWIAAALGVAAAALHWPIREPAPRFGLAARPA